MHNIASYFLKTECHIVLLWGFNNKVYLFRIWLKIEKIRLNLVRDTGVFRKVSLGYTFVIVYTNNRCQHMPYFIYGNILKVKFQWLIVETFFLLFFTLSALFCSLASFPVLEKVSWFTVYVDSLIVVTGRKAL